MATSKSPTCGRVFFPHPQNDLARMGAIHGTDKTDVFLFHPRESILKGGGILGGHKWGNQGGRQGRSSWAALLNAMLYSITETCRLHQVNVHEWLQVYLKACALHQDAPPNIEDFLPWRIKESGFPLGPAP